MKIGAVDLFCGVGGLTYGIQQAGIKIVAGIDLDESCRYPFEKNNNSEFIHKNISDVTGKEIRKLLKGYDLKILIGCAPCQPFSSHRKNKKNRQSHRDWSLLYQFSRVIKESKPHVISMENVPALVKEQVFTDFVNELKLLGYFVNYSIVNAADYGIAQRRKRLILIASKKNTICLIKPTHNKYNTVKDVIGDLPIIESGEMCKSDRLHQTQRLSPLNHMRIRASIPNGTWNDWPEKLILECHKKAGGKSYSSVYGRMKWEDVSPTITTQFTSYGTGRFGHPIQDRAITLREGALLQSFPLNYVFSKDDEVINIKLISKHIGNAVPPRLGEIIGRSIIEKVQKKRCIKL